MLENGPFGIPQNARFLGQKNDNLTNGTCFKRKKKPTPPEFANLSFCAFPNEEHKFTEFRSFGALFPIFQNFLQKLSGRSKLVNFGWGEVHVRIWR